MPESLLHDDFSDGDFLDPIARTTRVRTGFNDDLVDTNEVTR